MAAGSAFQLANKPCFSRGDYAAKGATQPDRGLQTINIKTARIQQQHTGSSLNKGSRPALLILLSGERCRHNPAPPRPPHNQGGISDLLSGLWGCTPTTKRDNPRALTGTMSLRNNHSTQTGVRNNTNNNIPSTFLRHFSTNPPRPAQTPPPESATPQPTIRHAAPNLKLVRHQASTPPLHSARSEGLPADTEAKVEPGRPEVEIGVVRHHASRTTAGSGPSEEREASPEQASSLPVHHQAPRSLYRHCTSGLKRGSRVAYPGHEMLDDRPTLAAGKYRSKPKESPQAAIGSAARPAGRRRWAHECTPLAAAHAAIRNA